MLNLTVLVFSFSPYSGLVNIPATNKSIIYLRYHDSYARFLNRGVTLGLVNPRLVGYPWGKSRGKFWRF